MAVIGTGASAMQLIPEIAPIVGELTVFQRTPAWIAPTPDYHDPIADGLRWLYAHVPSYSEFNRFCIFWAMGDGALGERHGRPCLRSDGTGGERDERRDASAPHGVHHGRVR